MTERPIIFSAPTIRSILSGSKTMTRRLTTSPLRKCEPGDLLWVRESVWINTGDVHAGRLHYRADEPDFKGQWTPSIHMPRWASRITLGVTSVKIERLQSITPADAIAEGMAVSANSYAIDCDTRNPVGDFRELWNSLHGPGAWAANPEVIAIRFRRVKP